ncbi:MAG: sialate O-acetylesterase [Ruminococcaceae bacterium]|nr:sialate O-acetylesterase [Oscillospiraceae bacterium]
MTIFKKILTTALMLICLAVTAFAVIEHLTDYYDKGMEFTVNDTLPNGEGKKARVILLAGQSNACGCSRDEYLKQNVSEEKYAEYQNGYDNVYINYSVTNYEQSGEFVKCGANQGEPGGYFGPELGMAEKLNELYPDETFFIVKFAWGGSNLHEQWRSQSSFGKSGELYRNFISFVHTSMDYLISKNYDVKIEGLCWMQGESDATTERHAKRYERLSKDFVKDIRSRLSDYAASDGIAFIDAYISEHWPQYKLLNESKQGVADSSSMNRVIDTISEGLTCSNEPSDNPDIAHYDSLSEIKLGHLFIENIADYLN